ncbi:Tos1p KNAG_0A03880 [Huiozyma naganishii CBS 8797]|uniref:glucan endo-1,3-beta-D-glucosidase n=1 Tax=Huiozyma naganishii (strain ATCC MYA-139 / BCRC 22969 / CBS 8797 / KCTC 17520 / NBRC 10181 / NCYC 3082 / Yp74L-3) TaxID=1071383 RepID=J7RTK3_HUIN7|nr:hypothetical protein KNAG_0A03880 [Kazachstania naganishii CBS 8797]CCK68067.1 hypothetical protein KNAG_0A03880 [Kazachstania naganishii CBS 8797]
MKISTLSSTVGLLAGLAKLVAADCSLSNDGNYYCATTNAIIYSNVGVSATYNDVTLMDETTCACSSQQVSFSGSLAPLDEELSVHFRGPVNLKQFAVYYPANGASLKKRDNVAEEECAEIVTKRKHRHKRDIAVEYVEVTATMYVDADGQTVTTGTGEQQPTTTQLVNDINVAEQTPTTTQQNTVATEQTPIQQTTPTTTTLSNNNYPPATTTAQQQETTTANTIATTATAPSSSNTNGGSVAVGSWERTSYFTPGSTSNCTFMNNQGGTAGSGTWSACFGNSISYAASNGVDGAGSAIALDDVTLKSGQEFMIFSGATCNGNECGYYREGIPAYHGFGGNQKIFVFEFEMPSDTNGNGYNQDMPAIWLLNAKIPRTLQYGKSECSCWETGCGEMDLFEILSNGSNKLISHVHDAQGGGTQDYFQRPIGNTLKAAVIFNGNDKSIHIVEIDGDVGATLDQATVQSWLSKSGSAAALP